MLFLFAGVPIDADVEVLQLERELGPPAIFVDHLYEVRAPDGVRYVHLEFQNKVTPALPGRLLRYAIYRYLCDAAAPLDSILVLPVPHAAATRVPEHAQVKVGRLEMTYGYSVVRLWELDPALIFELNRPALLPLITLARASDRDLERAAEEIVRERNVDLASVFATLGGLRYDRKRLTDLLEKKMIKEFLTPELMRESSFLKPMIEEWEKESGEKGEARGEGSRPGQGRSSGLGQGRSSRQGRRGAGLSSRHRRRPISRHSHSSESRDYGRYRKAARARRPSPRGGQPRAISGDTRRP